MLIFSLLANYWPIIDQLLINNAFFENFFISSSVLSFGNQKYITTHPGLDPSHEEASSHWRKWKIGPLLREPSKIFKKFWYQNYSLFIIGQLLANYWAIMDFFKTFTFFGTLYCLWIQSTSPHTLDSIHLIKRHCIIEENEKLAHVWGSHPRFCKSFGIKINLYSLLANYWPI